MLGSHFLVGSVVFLINNVCQVKWEKPSCLFAQRELTSAKLRVRSQRDEQTQQILRRSELTMSTPPEAGPSMVAQQAHPSPAGSSGVPIWGAAQCLSRIHLSLWNPGELAPSPLTPLTIQLQKEVL